MISSIFIDRPRLAFVVSIVITLAGPLASYGDSRRAVSRHRAAAGDADGQLSRRRRRTRSKPRWRSRSKRKSTASTMRSTTSPTSGADGTYTLNVTFALGTNPDIDTVNVQNRATPRGAATANHGAAAGSLDPQEIGGAAAGARRSTRRIRATTSFFCHQLRYDQRARRDPRASKAWDKPRCSVRSTIPCEFGSIRRGSTPSASCPPMSRRRINAQNMPAALGTIGGAPVASDQRSHFTVKTHGPAAVSTSSTTSCSRPIQAARWCASRTSPAWSLAPILPTAIRRFNGAPTAAIGIYQSPGVECGRRDQGGARQDGARSPSGFPAISPMACSSTRPCSSSRPSRR